MLQKSPPKLRGRKNLRNSRGRRTRIRPHQHSFFLPFGRKLVCWSPFFHESTTNFFSKGYQSLLFSTHLKKNTVKSRFGLVATGSRLFGGRRKYLNQLQMCNEVETAELRMRLVEQSRLVLDSGPIEIAASNLTRLGQHQRSAEMHQMESSLWDERVRLKDSLKREKRLQ